MPRDSDEDVYTSAPKDPAKSGEPKVPGAISSGPFEIDRASLAPAFDSSRHQQPLAALVETSLERGRRELPLSKILGISLAVFVVLVGLTLLLFR